MDYQENPKADDSLFPSRLRNSLQVSTRKYARIVRRWAEANGLDSSAYGTHTMRRNNT